MVAVEGLYENGRIRLSETAPMETARVIVIFPGDRNEKSHISDQTARELFDEFTGSIQRTIDEKRELLERLDEKYAGID